jgi:signal transduction histidine kinase
MELGPEYFGRRKDESEFPIEIGLSPLRTPRGLFALASIIDLTERRRAEEGLRASQKELQLLTGRLLEAQEAERRRIARDLHDDVNQSLALLAVEMDLLGQRSPASTLEVTRQLRELSARVKELSSSVHDLSHQLHPSKLEQLGLVAAVRGLCNELTQHHGLDVKFTHDDLPESIPEATALCLYRILQEALRNVVRHSGADHAVVELSGTSDEIHLRVSDGGGGFDPASVRRNGGLGLVSMRERLHLVGGEITIDSRPSGGTRIDVRVPAPARPECALQAATASG